VFLGIVNWPLIAEDPRSFDKSELENKVNFCNADFKDKQTLRLNLAFLPPDDLVESLRAWRVVHNAVVDVL